MRRYPITTLLLSLALAGCRHTVPLGGGKSLLCISRTSQKKFLANLGHPNYCGAVVSRSRIGDRLFVQFEDPTSSYSVAIVSSNGLALKSLPGEGCLDEEGAPVFWTGWSNRMRIPFRLRGGAILPTNVYPNGPSDGRFVSMFRAHQDHWWIASVESPLEEILTLDWEKEFEFLISKGNRLHVFVRGKPEGKPRPDRWFILKRYEYEINDNKARLLEIQDFYFTWTVLDFDPESRLMYAASWNVPFAHGIIVDTATGRRKNVRGRGGRGYIVSESVARRFEEALK
jgi:hypothetical protein